MVLIILLLSVPNSGDFTSDPFQKFMQNGTTSSLGIDSRVDSNASWIGTLFMVHLGLSILITV
jgi:hypothetical protein